jgi:hypothetical protein
VVESSQAIAVRNEELLLDFSNTFTGTRASSPSRWMGRLRLRILRSRGCWAFRTRRASAC